MYTTPPANRTYRRSGDKQSTSPYQYGMRRGSDAFTVGTAASPPASPTSSATEHPGREAGMLAFLCHFYRLFFYSILPSTLHTIRVRVTAIVTRLVRWTIMSVQFTFAVVLGGWLLTSAWWIAAAVAVGAWSATVAVASIAAGHQLLRSFWPTSLHGWLGRWMSYMTWPLVWLQAWRRQRLHQRRQQQRQRRSSRRARPDSPMGSPTRSAIALRSPARAHSPSAASATASSSGTVTPNRSPRLHTTPTHFDPYCELVCGRSDSTGYSDMGDVALHSMHVRIAAT